MSVVDVKIGTRNFSLACEDGQEDNLQLLAGKVNDRFEILSKQMRTQNDSLLLLLSALMAEDELQEFQAKFDSNNIDPKMLDKQESDMTDIVNTVSDYIETIIGKIEGKVAS